MRLLFIVFILVPNIAFACFCTAPTELTAETVKNSDIVFKGTVSDIVSEDGHNKQVKFKIKEIIKGEEVMNVTIEFDTFSSCAIRQEFKINEYYLISATKKTTGSSKQELNELYQANLCSLIKKLRTYSN